MKPSMYKSTMVQMPSVDGTENEEFGEEPEISGTYLFRSDLYLIFIVLFSYVLFRK